MFLGHMAVGFAAKRVAPKYEGELELTVYIGAEGLKKFEEYRLFCVPAAVVNGAIRIEGMGPDEATLNNALREGGLCLK